MATPASNLHERSASSPQLKAQLQSIPHSHQSHQSVPRPRRQFGQPPPQSTFLSSSPNATNGSLPNNAPTPPPKSPQSRPTTTNGHGHSQSLSNSQGQQPSPSVSCPICNITLRNLAQLNQHLDTIHPEEPEDVKSAVTSFFRNAQKVLNPITKQATTTFKNIPANSTELLRKIQDLDLDAAPGNSLAGPPTGGFQGWTDPRADAVVTKRHWVRETSDRDVCFHANCDKGLGIRYGRQHCRSCGNMFCETHSSFQIKLNAQAKHDASGLWCRVCENCFVRAKKAEDNLNAGGVHRKLTTDFMSIRIKSAEKKHLEVNRLEKRIEKLAQIHLQFEPNVTSSPTPSTNSSTFSSISSGTSSIRAKGLFRSVTTSRAQQLKTAEQAIVKWEDDATVVGCYICLSLFNRYGNRKHHCRLCGRVICDNCSKKTPLYLSMSSYPDGSDPVGQTRACKECIHTVFKRREHAADQKRPNAVLKYYGSLMRLKERIDLALPKFQEMLSAIGQKSDMNQGHPDYQLAARTRKELLDDFALFDSISKKIARLPSHSQHQKQLHTNLYWWATQYLQTNMFPLSVIPKVFGNNNNANGRPGSPSVSLTPSTSSPRPGSALDSNSEGTIEQLAQLAVMEEQRQLVESYIEEATKKRRFDDVKSLKMSLDELESEMAAIRSGKRS
ncbi:carboxypeptidase Y-deficient [Podila verticillata]|nr:carboxypeptidase Y-deficient [Podila verticillata]